MAEAPTTPLKPLSPAELAVCSNVGGRLATGEIDASTALRWLQGWSLSTPGAVDAREGVDGARDDDEGGAFVMPGWLGAALPGWAEEVGG